MSIVPQVNNSAGSNSLKTVSQRFFQPLMKAFNSRTVCAGVLIFSAALTANGQAGTSSTSFSLSRSMAEGSAASTRTINIPTPNEIVVDELINYHRHKIRVPNPGENVAIDMRWGGNAIDPAQPEAILQIGFATNQIASSQRTNLRPLNLTLVIDKSGSMSGEKIVKVQEALLVLLKHLRPNDIVSIVAFDHEAQVVLPPQPLTDKQAATQAILNLNADGGTEIYKGLMLGYQQALHNLRKDFTNRVILLTDGISNPGTIFADSLKFNRLGIDLATIGIGSDVNEPMLRQLAKQGRGLFHFVADPRDTKKIFEKELESLLSPVARDVQMQVTFDPELHLAKIYGYLPKFNGNQVTIDLDDMNHGLTQVVLMKFQLQNYSGKAALPVQLKLSYFDLTQDKIVTRVESVMLPLAVSSSNGVNHHSSKGKSIPDTIESDIYVDAQPDAEESEIYRVNDLNNSAGSNSKGNSPNNQHQNGKKSNQRQTQKSACFAALLNDDEVRKNYAIAVMAQAMKDMSIAWSSGNKKQAETILTAGLMEVDQLYQSIADKDIKRLQEILQLFKQSLTGSNQIQP